MNVQINNLRKEYNGITVLNVPTLTLNEGELIGLVGNNGAGKTTLMRLILDLIQATEGSVENDGHPVATDDAWKEYTGSFIDDSFLINFYTPEEYFDFIAEVYGISKDELQTRLQQYEELMAGEILGKKKLIKEFSMGNRQKIGIIGAMIIHPKFLMLDEPFNYLDPSSQILVARMLEEMNKTQGTTILISSHNLTSVTDICTRILLLEKGTMIKDLVNEPDNTTLQELETYFTH